MDNIATDVLIAGGGPAALLLARETAKRGLRTTLVSPALTTPWHPRYAVWMDEVEPHGFSSVIHPVYQNCEIRSDGDRVRTLARAYGRVNGEALQSMLIDDCMSLNVRVVEDVVAGVKHEEKRT